MGWLLAAAVLAWLIALVAYDIRQHRLPNVLTLPGALVIIVSAGIGGRGIPAIAGAAALTAVYLLVHLGSPRGMGAGDVKLAVGLGALTGSFGLTAWASAAVGAPVLTVLWACAARQPRVPHGPAMCLASAVALVTL